MQWYEVAAPCILHIDDTSTPGGSMVHKQRTDEEVLSASNVWLHNSTYDAPFALPRWQLQV